MSRSRALLGKLLSVAFGCLFAFLLIEPGLRLLELADPWAIRNFTIERINQQTSNVMIKYDPILGYIPLENYKSADYNHGAMGLRTNQTLRLADPIPPIPQGGILASGDSFTYGSEVRDAETWPAYLETETKLPTVNVGVGGYGIDQAILRAEQMFDAVKPKVIIVSFIPNNVGRNEYSVNSGLIKPYFDIENDQLVLKGTPVPDYKASRKHIGNIRTVLGYSYALYWLFDRVGLRDWWLVGNYENRTVHKRGVEVSCRMWSRLSEKYASQGVKLIALAQYAGTQVIGADNARDYYRVEEVLNCAHKAGYLIVDSWDELRRQYAADEKSFWANWVREPHDEGRTWNTGHMSPKGNKMTADLVATAIRENYPELLPQ